jgi:TPR repeat protein
MKHQPNEIVGDGARENHGTQSGARPVVSKDGAPNNVDHMSNQSDGQDAYALGDAYSEGMQVDKDKVTEWRRSADRGDCRAQAAIGRAYALGRGVPRNFVLAYMWSALAVSQGDADSVDVRDSIDVSLTPQQLAKAERLVREWRHTTGC